MGFCDALGIMCDADEAAEAGLKGLVQIRLEGGQPQAPKAVNEGLSSQQISDVLQHCEAEEVRGKTGLLQQQISSRRLDTCRCIDFLA